MGIRSIGNLFFLNRNLLVMRDDSIGLVAWFEVLLHFEDFLKIQRNWIFLDMIEQLTVKSWKLHFAANLLKVSHKDGALTASMEFKFLAVLLKEHFLHCWRIGWSKKPCEVVILVSELEQTREYLRAGTLVKVPIRGSKDFELVLLDRLVYEVFYQGLLLFR